MADILTQIHGREIGLDKDGGIVLNHEDGTQTVYPKGGALTAAQVAALDDGIATGGVLRQLTYRGSPIPDPRRRAGISCAPVTSSATSDYLDPHYSRRIMVCMDAATTNSAVTADAPGHTLTLFPNAAAAGLRVDEPASPARAITTQASNSAAVINVKEF